MTKRLLFSALSVFLISVFVLSGCSKKADATTDDQQNPDEQTEESTGNEETETASVDGHLLRVAASDLVYLIDDDGKKIASYDLNEIRENIHDEAFPFSPGGLIDEYDGVLYFRDYSAIPGREDEYGYTLYAYEPEGIGTLYVWSPAKESGYSIEKCGIYNGELYATVCENDEYKEVYFVRNGDHFEAQKTDYSDIVHDIQWDNVILYSPDGDNSHGCISQLFDEVGFAILFDYNEGQHIKLYPDGSREAIDDMPLESVYMINYDKDGIVFIDPAYTDEYRSGCLEYYDMKSELSTVLFGMSMYDDVNRVLTYDDGLIYLQKNMSLEYGHASNAVYTLDPVTLDYTALYTLDDTPGVSNMVAVADQTSGYNVINGNIFAPEVVGDQVMWVRVDYDGDNADFVDIDCPLQTINALKLGSVEYYSENGACPECGTPIRKYYAEYFQLDPKYSDKADSINKVMKDTADKGLKAEQETAAEYVPEEDCEEHMNYPDTYCFTTDVKVTDVSIIYDKYLLVNSDSYLYGGGAHGMPGMSQFIFDLDTGKQLGIRDFVDCSENEFIEVCAQKTVEDLKTYDEYTSPYYEYDEDAVYEDAKTYISFDDAPIMFDEDGAYINYPPYTMGPYASGFIQVRLFDSSIY